jgi:hypothetical protein
VGYFGVHRDISQLCDLAIDHGVPCMALVQDLQVLQDIDGLLPKDILRSGVDGLGKDKVRVLVQADDQGVRGEDGLDKVHLMPDIVVGGDKWDVLVAPVVDETGWRLVGPRAAAQSSWVHVGVEE